uniref:Calcineurin-like phosphoesterase domain-containing protein n=1 Tax=Trichuris muris TaxID=70415 RepID=A0A5S6QBU4_TRIMR
MLSASVMKMIKKSESIRERSGNERKHKLQTRYKRSFTEEVKGAGDDDGRTQGAECPRPADVQPVEAGGGDVRPSPKVDLLQKRFSHVNISDIAECKTKHMMDPDVAWELMKKSLVVEPVEMTSNNEPQKDGFCRFVCIADTCSKHDQCKVPDGDVLIVAGNFTTCGHPDEIRAFNNYLGLLPHKHKVLVPGESELTLDKTWLSRQKPPVRTLKRRSKSVYGFREDSMKHALRKAMFTQRINTADDLLTNCVFLCDNDVEINGIRIYGTPCITDCEKQVERWNRIPMGIDILVTHIPPLGYGDVKENGVRSGCAELLQSVVNRVKPQFHVFGQTVRGYGRYTNGTTQFVNCCICDAKMNPKNEAVIFDFKLDRSYKFTQLRNDRPSQCDRTDQCHRDGIAAHEGKIAEHAYFQSDERGQAVYYPFN